MKETGILRRVDELGRIVIPKELRKNLRIKEGDSLEIYVEEDQKIILTKHSPFRRMEDDFYQLARLLYDKYHNTVLLCDDEKVRGGYGQEYGKYLERVLSPVYRVMCTKKEIYRGTLPSIVDQMPNTFGIYLYPLVLERQVIGSICMIEDGASMNELASTMMEFIGAFFAKQIEL